MVHVVGTRAVHVVGSTFWQYSPRQYSRQYNRCHSKDGDVMCGVVKLGFSADSNKSEAVQGSSLMSSKAA